MNSQTNYTYTIDSEPDNVKKINLQFSKEYIENIYNEEAEKIKNKAVIRGFRPGKIPEYLFKRIFHKDIVKSKILEMLNDILKEIVEKEKIKPFSDDLVFYKKEDIEKVVENNYMISLEIPSLPDFSKINFGEITLKNIQREPITDEFITNFIEIEKLKVSKMSPKRKDALSDENDILEVSLNLYESVDAHTEFNTTPTISYDNVHIFLYRNLLPYFSHTKLNDYTIDLNELLGLENGTFKKIICTKARDGIIQKACIDIWVKKIYSVEKNDNSIQEVIKLWQATNENTLKTKVVEFLEEIEEYEKKMQLFNELLRIIIEKYRVNINYSQEIEKVIVKSYLENFVEQSKLKGIPKDIVEKYLKNFNISDNYYRIYKLELLLIKYFSNEVEIRPSEDDIFKLFCIMFKRPPYTHIKDEILRNKNIIGILLQEFTILKIIEKILSITKVEDKNLVNL